MDTHTDTQTYMGTLYLQLINHKYKTYIHKNTKTYILIISQFGPLGKCKFTKHSYLSHFIACLSQSFNLKSIEYYHEKVYVELADSYTKLIKFKI